MRRWQMSGVSFSNGVGVICPSMRSAGATPEVMCKSEARF